MSKEQLKAFLEKVKDDTSLQDRLKTAKSQDEVVSIAKEHGHDDLDLVFIDLSIIVEVQIIEREIELHEGCPSPFAAKSNNNINCFHIWIFFGIISSRFELLAEFH